MRRLHAHCAGALARLGRGQGGPSEPAGLAFGFPAALQEACEQYRWWRGLRGSGRNNCRQHLHLRRRPRAMRALLQGGHHRPKCWRVRVYHGAYYLPGRAPRRRANVRQYRPTSVTRRGVWHALPTVSAARPALATRRRHEAAVATVQTVLPLPWQESPVPCHSCIAN